LLILRRDARPSHPTGLSKSTARQQRDWPTPSINGATRSTLPDRCNRSVDILSLFFEMLFDAADAQRATGKCTCSSGERQFAVAQIFSSN
jgi:hypothetical protein